MSVNQEIAALMEMNKKLMETISSFGAPSSRGSSCLPKFDPAHPETDSKTWLATAEMCSANAKLEGAALLAALCMARKGDAAVWFGSMCFTAPMRNLVIEGESFSFCFDSGSECSLVRESGVLKRSVKNDIVMLRVPNDCLPVDLLIGREVLAGGVVVEMKEGSVQFRIERQVCVVSGVSEEKVVPSADSVDLDLVVTDAQEGAKRQLIELLLVFKSFFITEFPKTCVTTGILEIRLVDPSKTVLRHLYRFSHEEREILRKRVDELFEANIIRHSCSPFSSPALLVRKERKVNRCVIDYYELNRNTVSDNYPVPLISDLVSRMYGAKFFSQIDCASGFHLIEVEEQSIEKTAFCTPDGQYEFHKMPFGHRDGSQVFRRAIMKALGDIV